MTPCGVETISVPTPTAGRYLCSQSTSFSDLTGNLGEITPHLFILPISCTRSFPPTPSSMNSNSPMYRRFWRTLSTSLARLEAGMTMHSFLFLISEFWRLAKRLARMFVAAMSFLLVVLPEAELLSDFSEALPAEHKVVGPDHRAVLSAALAVVCRLPVLPHLCMPLFHTMTAPNFSLK